MGVLRPGPVRGGLVEREVELGEIDLALAGANAGEGKLLLLEGPAGIGKTALLAAARERAGRAGVVVLVARGGQLEGGFPYGVVRQLFEPTVRAANAAQRAQLLAGAAALAQPVVLGGAAVPADPVDQGFSIVHGLYWLVANLAGQAPVALLIDDVHWADPPSLRFLVYLARRLDGLAVTVIASVRTGDGGSEEGLRGELENSPGGHLVPLSPLTGAGVTSVLSADFGQSPDPAFADACRHLTAGNPFFVRELAAALKADEIEPTAEAAKRVSAIVPQTIARVTLARVGRLPADALELARAIAVLDGDATLPRAASLAGLDERRALAALDALHAANLIGAGSAPEFRHPIVRTALYDELSVGARSIAHRRAAALLAAEGAELDVVAGQLLASRPIGARETIATLRDAATHALALGAPDSASSYLARALEEGPDRELRATVMLELGTAELLAGQPGAADRFEEVRRLTEDPVTRATAMIEHAGLAYYSGDPHLPLTLLDGALSDLTDGPETLRLRAEGLRAQWTLFDARLLGAFNEHEPTLRQLASSGRPGTRPLALLLAASDAWRDGPADPVIALAERGWDAGRYLDDRDTLELLPQAIGTFLLYEHFDQAAAIVEQLRLAAGATGSVMQYLTATVHSALINTRRGNLGAAAAELRAGLERALELQLQVAVASTLWYCADVLVERPDVADLAALAESIELGPFAQIQPGALLILTRGRLRFAAGERAAGIADLRHAGASNDALGFTDSSLSASWRSTLALMLDRSQRDEALALVDAELAIARHSGQPRRIGVALRALGLLDPDPDAAHSTLQEAVAVLAGSPAPLEHARALVELGAMRRRHGDRVAARAPLRDGLDLATRCGATRLAERARTELAATGARPRGALLTGRDALTPSELRVALMAAEGRTSQEIAQALFVTTRTIDGHLNRTYAKLGITSRRQLPSALT